MFDQMPGHMWIDGKIVPWKDAKLHVMTHALHYASSVYEGLRSYDGRLFKGKEHFKRLHQSAKYLDFEIPYSEDILLKATEMMIDKGRYSEGYVRVISWCGSKVMTVSHRDADVHTAIGIWERPVSYPETFFSKGIDMNIATWRRPDPKTAPVHSKAAGLYMISSLSKKAAENLGYQDSLMLDYQGNIAEATSSNIFLVIDGKLYTPLPTCFLNGITRLTCIDIAKKLGIEVFETTLSLDELSRASEVFLTGTAVEILPVGTIQGERKTWTFQPGPVTSELLTTFKRLTKQQTKEAIL